MKVVILLLLAGLLAGCVAAHDQGGNVYPPEALGEMTCTPTVCTLNGVAMEYKVVPVSKMPLDKRYKPYWGWYDYASGTALISEAVPDRKDAIRHELAHKIAGHWHPE